ncbi:metal ABC transporter solute-binding protein, Zn/Mn family [Moritella sp. Urea-trap-13]|uniref:metal ABC transporter solute-binding protein, Zn/Mn family n=1 Tax=Moritella sp. Urea-trap-13 TaxID=2058327 RepID=UPI000C328E16|nr:zinc ABC transporter substrate-binding protein [Moritella sp. Urea-trap-13]PKH05621.1 metal ABC transporter substrate-binding protein [Moritella sp. Urea-trap-13]
MLKNTLTTSMILLGLGASSAAMAEQKLAVISSFSILGDLVSEVGKEHVTVTNLVKIDGDAHVFSPTPQDAKAISKAQLVVTNGLQFEGWMPRLIEAANYQGVQVIAADGIDELSSKEGGCGHDHHDHEQHNDEHEHHDHEQHNDEHEHEHHDHEQHNDEHDHHDHELHNDEHEQHSDEHAHHDHEQHSDEHEHRDHAHHDHGDIDPHAWHSINNVKVYVRNIAKGLIQVDPKNRLDYQQNAAHYTEELDQLALKLCAQLATIPEAQRKVITPHDAFAYFARDFNVTFLSPQGTSTGSEASAADVAKLIKQIRHDNVNAVFMENIADNRLIEQISRETDAKIGGKLYSDALSSPDQPASTYLKMMQYNVNTIVDALK